MSVVDPSVDPWVADYEKSEPAPPKPRRQPAPRLRPPKPAREQRVYPIDPDLPSEDAVAQAFVDHHPDHIHVPPWHKWLRWNGKNWQEDGTGLVYERIRMLVRSLVKGKACRSTANSHFIGGVEKLMRTDQRIAVMPDRLDADPWALNTQTGIVDLRTGAIRPHDPDELCSRVTRAGVDPLQGSELWDEFLHDITQGSNDLREYLQRVTGYCATGVTPEDILVYLFGIGANGKSSFAEAVAFALGDYAKQFAPEVLMENNGQPGHPTELAQFRGVRFGLTSEPGSSAAWNDSRIKALTGDAVINARVMRGDPFEFKRTHKTMVLGNHMPKLSEVSNAIKRRVQMVPFRAVFDPAPGPGMRERLRDESSGAILAWVIRGAQLWRELGTKPPEVVRDMTADYLGEQDLIGQWLARNCERVEGKFFERSSDLHRNYAKWCEGEGHKPKSSVRLTENLSAAGFRKKSSAIGKVFHGIKLKLD